MDPRYAHWINVTAVREHFAGGPLDVSDLTDDQVRVIAWAALRGGSLQEALHEALITAPHDEEV